MLRALSVIGAIALVGAACSSFTGNAAPEPDGGTPTPGVDGGNTGADVDVPDVTTENRDPYDAASKTSPYAAAVLHDAPLAYFRLAEGSGDAINLGSLTDYTLTYGSGVTRAVPGLIAGDGDLAMHLDGVAGLGKVVTGPQNSSLQPPQKITLECWFRRDGGATFSDGGPNQFEYLISYDLRATSPFQSWVLQMDGAQPSTHFASGDDKLPAITNGKTYHFVVTYNDGNEIAYINGVATTLGHSGDIEYDNDSARGLDIGGNSRDLNNVFNGTIDEVAIYGEALSPTSVLAHYNAGSVHL